MPTKITRPTPSIFKQIIRVLKPWWISEEKRIAWFGLAGLIGLAVLFVWLSVLVNDWNRQFFDALERKELDAFTHLILKFIPLMFSFIAVFLMSFWLAQWLSFRWRLWLTHKSQRNWLDNKSYYLIPLVGDGMDNPDQRISVDARNVPYNTIGLFTGLFQKIT